MDEQPRDDATGVGLFEVFKMGHLTPADVAALSDEDLRRQYSLLMPFTDRAQLQPPYQLAALPKPGHIVVDKTHFQDMMAREAKRDEPLFRAHDVFAHDRQMIAALLRDTITAQQEQLRVLVTDHTQAGKEKHELLTALKDFMGDGQKLWHDILSHSFFSGDEGEKSPAP